MQGELLNFRSYLERLFALLYSLFPKKSKFRNDLNHTEQLFKKDLIKQFKKFIRTDGKYSSEIFLKERKNTNIFLMVEIILRLKIILDRNCFFLFLYAKRKKRKINIKKFLA